MQINKETVAFIGELNAMAKRRAKDKQGRLVPFSVLRYDKKMQEIYEKLGLKAQTRIFYDDKSPKTVFDEIYYPIVTQIVLQLGRYEIVSVSDRFFAVFPKKLTDEEKKQYNGIHLSPYVLAVMSVSDNLKKDVHEVGNTVLIEKDGWYVVE